MLVFLKYRFTLFRDARAAVLVLIALQVQSTTIRANVQVGS